MPRLFLLIPATAVIGLVVFAVLIHRSRTLEPPTPTLADSPAELIDFTPTDPAATEESPRDPADPLPDSINPQLLHFPHSAPAGEFFGSAPLDSLMIGDRFPLRVAPTAALPLRIRTNQPTSPDGQNRVITAEIEGVPFGRVIISQHGDARYASIHGAELGDAQIFSQADGAYRLEPNSPANTLPCAGHGSDSVNAHVASDGLADSPTPPALPFDSFSAALPAGNTIQDVLILFNEQARVSVGGNPLDSSDDSDLRARIQAAVAAANLAYADSNIPLTLRDVAVLPVSYSYPTNEPLGRALAELGSPSDGFLDDIHALRDLHAADIVSLWIDSAVAGGLANVLTANSPPAAFNVVRALNPPDTFAHEVGHNQGNRHLRSGYPSTPSSWFPDSFAHLFMANGTNYVTIMASTSDASDANATRLLRFAAPEIAYLGIPTGVLNLSNTAATLRANRDLIAAFRSAPAPFHSSPSAPPVLKLAGKSRLVTGRARIRLRGTASSPSGIDRITYRATATKGLQTARGTSRWDLRVALKRHRTVVRIFAFTSTGQRSNPRKVTVIRR